MSDEQDRVDQRRMEFLETPDIGQIRNVYAAFRRAFDQDGDYEEFLRQVDRAIAYHDRELREQIADDLRIEALNEDPDIPDTYREGVRDGLMRGVDIARGEGSE